MRLVLAVVGVAPAVAPRIAAPLMSDGVAVIG